MRARVAKAAVTLPDGELQVLLSLLWRQRRRAWETGCVKLGGGVTRRQHTRLHAPGYQRQKHEGWRVLPPRHAPRLCAQQRRPPPAPPQAGPPTHALAAAPPPHVRQPSPRLRWQGLTAATTCVTAPRAPRLLLPWGWRWGWQLASWPQQRREGLHQLPSRPQPAPPDPWHDCCCETHGRAAAARRAPAGLMMQLQLYINNGPP